MTRAELINALIRAADLAGQKLGPPDGRPRWAHIPPLITSEFSASLLDVPEISAMQGLWYSLPYESGLLDLRHRGVHLIDRALDVPAQLVVDDLLRFASERTIDLVSVQAIEGLTVSTEVSLGRDWSIAPPEALVPSPWAKQVFSSKNVPQHGFGRAPTAAIVRRQLYSVILRSEGAGALADFDLRRAEEVEKEAAVWVAALSSGGAPDLRQAYDVIASPGWPGMESGGMRESYSFPRPVPGVFPLDEDLAQTLLEPVIALRSRIEVALSKLLAARRRHTDAESVIDLGTCLEVLLMKGDSSTAEIGHKVALRAAWLLGEGDLHRLEVFECARKLYGARSAAAHTGNLPAKKGAGSHNLAAYDALCAALILKFLKQGRWPDWTRLVLGVDAYG